MANKSDYVELGLACANVCRALDRGMNGKKMDDLSQSVREAIAQLTMWVKLVMSSVDKSLMMLLIAELWQRYRRMLSRKVDGTYSPDSSMRRMTRKRFPPGS